MNLIRTSPGSLGRVNAGSGTRHRPRSPLAHGPRRRTQDTRCVPGNRRTSRWRHGRVVRASSGTSAVRDGSGMLPACATRRDLRGGWRRVALGTERMSSGATPPTLAEQSAHLTRSHSLGRVASDICERAKNTSTTQRISPRHRRGVADPGFAIELAAKKLGFCPEPGNPGSAIESSPPDDRWHFGAWWVQRQRQRRHGVVLSHYLPVPRLCSLDMAGVCTLRVWGLDCPTKSVLVRRARREFRMP